MRIRTILVTLIVSAVACSAPAPTVSVSTATPTITSTAPPQQPSVVPGAAPTPSPLPIGVTHPPAPALVVTTVALGPLHGQIAWVSRMVSRGGSTGPQLVALVTYELWAIPLDGSAPRMAVRYLSAVTARLVVPPGSGNLLGSQRDTNVLRRQFSPDGRRIVLSVAASDDGSSHELRVIDLETGAISIPFPGAAHLDVNPAWSPDGAHIAFVRLFAVAPGFLDVATPGDLWVANPDGGSAKRLWTGGGTGAPRVYGWLPDSQRIAFDLNIDHRGLALIDLSGNVSASIYYVTSDDPVSWRSGSPALTAGLGTGNPPNRSQIVVSDGPDQRVPQIVADVTLNPNDNTVTGVRDPRWDPAGSRVLIYVETGVQGSFVIADLDARTTKKVSSRVAFADWMSLTDIVTLGDIVTLEEHPSTAPLSVSVYERDGRLRSSRLFLLPNDSTYALTDLAARAY